MHLVLISVPTHFGHFMTSYNYVSGILTLNQLILHFVEEEEKLKKDKAKSAHLTSTFKDKGKKRKQDKQAVNTIHSKKQQKKPIELKGKCCFFRGVEGHQKKHHTNYYALRVKKSVLLALICFEVNLTLISRYMWLWSLDHTYNFIEF